TSGFARSSSVKPTALSIARAGARSTPSVRSALRRLAGSVGLSYTLTALASNAPMNWQAERLHEYSNQTERVACSLGSGSFGGDLQGKNARVRVAPFQLV